MDRVSYYARKYGIPESLARAQIGQESGGNRNAVSPKGATGLTQVLPSTAAGMYGISEAEAARRLHNPEFALDAWGRYMKKAYSTFGNWRLALAAYNAGFGAVTKYHGIPPYEETQHYVQSILSKAGVFKSSGTPAGSTGLVQPSAGGVAAPAGPSPLEGLRALASGHYDPVQALEGLREQAQTGALRSQIATSGTPQISVNVHGRMTPTAKKAVNLIQEYQGVPYVWGGESPKGFDCSGLLQYVWGKVGVNIPRTSYDQWGAGRMVGKGQLRPGDAVFFRGSDSKNGLPGHVGMYIGAGRFIEAPHTGSTVHISKLAGRSDYMGARRYA